MNSRSSETSLSSRKSSNSSIKLPMKLPGMVTEKGSKHLKERALVQASTVILYSRPMDVLNQCCMMIIQGAGYVIIQGAGCMIIQGAGCVIIQNQSVDELSISVVRNNWLEHVSCSLSPRSAFISTDVYWSTKGLQSD